MYTLVYVTGWLFLASVLACRDIFGYVCLCTPPFMYPAQPCPTLYAPLHGGISCTGEQVTDETCYFTCDPGYELLGSAERFCQPTNTWTGQHTSCRILHCPVLNGNDDTFIVYPCDTAFNSSCMLQCTPGHYYRDPNTNFIRCIAGPVHETVIWTDRPMCEGRLLQLATLIDISLLLSCSSRCLCPSLIYSVTLRNPTLPAESLSSWWILQ